MPPLFVFHHANAFQEAADPSCPGHVNVTVQSVTYPSLPDFGADIKAGDFLDMDVKSQPRSLLHENTFRIHEADGTAEFVQSTQLLDRCVEFPSVHPQLFGQRWVRDFASSKLPEHCTRPQSSLGALPTSHIRGGNDVIWSFVFCNV